MQFKNHRDASFMFKTNQGMAIELHNNIIKTLRSNDNENPGNIFFKN